MLLLDQVIDVRNTDLSWEAGINRPAAGAGPIKIRTGVIGVNDVFRLHTQALKISIEQRRVGIDVQHTGNAHAKFLAIFDEGDAIFGRLVPKFRHRNRVGYILRIDWPKDLAGREVHEVGIFVFDLVNAGFDVFHVVDIFDQPLFAGCNDQPLFAVHQRNFGDFLNGNECHVIFWSGSDSDEGRRAIVLAEVAARAFVARSAILDFSNRIQTAKRRLLAVAPQAHSLRRRADRARLSAELVHDDLGFLAGGAETVVDEIH